jgi:ABC-type antimicrobial peptide transport system permease subunit
MYWVVRSQGDPRLLGDAVRRAVQRVDSDVATSSVRTLDDVVSASLGARRASVRLLETFGELAIALCGFGVYAITAFAVSGRRREFAIRSAFGASPRQLAALMFREEMRPVAAGLILGLAAAAATAPLLVGTVFETSRWDPAVYAASAGVLLALAALASYLPSARASRVEPIAALRAD